MQENRSKDWINQADNDLLWAHDTLKRGYFSQTCFIAQQIGEKALKALAHHRGLTIRGHSIKDLAETLKINGEILSAGKKLDFYYISSRYPDAFPSGAPFEYFSQDQAEEAYNLCCQIVAAIKKLLKE